MKMSNEDKYRMKTLEQCIEDGELEAMFTYAQLYVNEYPEEVTEEIAKKIVKCYETCMEAGNLTAALNLGALYYEGNFIERDFQKAIHLYELATESDNSETQVRAWCNLGYCYYYGRDIPVDNEKAFNCYMHAALMNDANALYKVGDMYRYGRYVQKDERMAVDFYRKAWDATDETMPSWPDICKRVGECALYGIGMEKNAFLAFRLLTQAESYTYLKIRERDPFAASLLPKIEKMVSEAKTLVHEQLNI